MKYSLMSFTFIFLCSFVLSAQAVELKDADFRSARNDIIRLYEGAAINELSWFTATVTDKILQLQPPESSQGQIIIKLPVQKDNILILQAPHQYFDLHTGDIARHWFGDSDAQVLMLNTEHRYETDNSDLSRLEKSVFTAVTAGFIGAGGSGIVVQLHGFNDARRQTVSAQHADFILSNGKEKPTLDMVTAQSCLRDSGKLLARVYGRDVFELGATINPVGRLINHTEQSKVRFLHIEMPRHIRLALKNQDIHPEVITCLLRIR